MIDAIIIIGKPGSGKSVMVWYLNGLLDQDGIAVTHHSDRLGLEEAVLEDTKSAKKLPDGSKLGIHSKLIADGPPGHRKVHVLDGTILNRVHEEMIASLVKRKKETGVALVEYAIGPDIDFGSGKEKLLQSAHHLVSHLEKYHVTTSVFVVDVEAGLAVRGERQEKRPDAMAEETFRAYFPDGGEIGKKEEKILRGHYYRFRNREEDHDGYYSEARYLYEAHILPGLGGKQR
ncbi:MAG: hypothetical protein Q7S76_00805 [bacterium]|nr:hypothetical protein [bacterium]